MNHPTRPYNCLDMIQNIVRIFCTLYSCAAVWLFVLSSRLLDLHCQKIISKLAIDLAENPGESNGVKDVAQLERFSIACGSQSHFTSRVSGYSRVQLFLLCNNIFDIIFRHYWLLQLGHRLLDNHHVGRFWCLGIDFALAACLLLVRLDPLICKL